MRTAPLLAAALLSGCAGTNIPGVESLRPTVNVRDFAVERVTFQEIETSLVLGVHNPYPFDLDMTRVRWSIDIANAVEVGGQRAGTTLAAQAESRLAVPFTLRWTEILPAVQAVVTGERLPWTLTGTGTFDTPLGDVQVPFDATGTLAPLRRPGSGS